MHSASILPGANLINIPGLRTPVSTLPTGTVPIPPILYTSYKGNLSGLSTGLLGASRASKASTIIGPLYQGILVDLSNILSPLKPEIGMKGMVSGL